MGQNKPKKLSKTGPESLRMANMDSKWARIGPEPQKVAQRGLKSLKMAHELA